MRAVLLLALVALAAARVEPEGLLYPERLPADAPKRRPNIIQVRRRRCRRCRFCRHCSPCGAASAVPLLAQRFEA